MDDYEIIEERERQAFVAILIERGMLDDVALGVARQFVDRGHRSLSDKQRHVLITHVLGTHSVDECSICGNAIPMSEQVEALDNGGKCGYCVYRWSKVLGE